MDKGFKYMFWISVILIVADLLSTLINWELFQHLEANPLYAWGGLPIIIIFNILFLLGMWYIYKNTYNPTIRYIVIFALVTVVTTRFLVIISNVQIFLNPPTLQQAMAVTKAEKVAHVMKLVYLNLLPYLNGVIAFFFFERDHTILKKLPQGGLVE